jgi:hypothetical protein
MGIERLIKFKEVFKNPTKQLYSVDDKLSLEPIIYGEVISDFVDTFYDCNLFTENWEDFREVAWDNYKTTGWIENLDFKKTCLFLMIIIREEKLCNGLLLGMVKDGTINKILERLEELNTK